MREASREGVKTRDRGPNHGFAHLVVAACIALIAATCEAQQVKVADAWARATVAGQKTAAAYAELTSATDAFLVAAASPVAERIELHSMRLEGEIMRMRPVQRIALPAQRTVKLAPGGLHLMLFGVSRPLKPGEKLPLVFTFEVAGGGKSTLKVEAEVRAAGAASVHQH